MATFLNSSVSNQLISLASREKHKRGYSIPPTLIVSNQLISLASREMLFNEEGEERDETVRFQSINFPSE